MKLIDTHAHLSFEGLAENVSDVISRAKEAGVSGCITVGTTPGEFEQVLGIAENNDGVWAAMGIHPHYAKDVSAGDIERLKEIAKSGRIVAVGETGLDFHYNFSKQDSQVELFVKHLEIAAETGLPVIVHCRNAFEQTLDVLNDFDGKLSKVVFHCYSGDEEQTQTLLERGYYISFTGIVTFKSAELARVAAKIVPTGRMMLETDCPYMSPTPMRKQKINEPALMVHTAKFIAELKEMDCEKFCDEVLETSLKFFNLAK